MGTDTLLARELMTRKVVTVPPGMPVTSLARLLADRGISAVPVTDALGRLLGIVTEADLLRRPRPRRTRRRAGSAAYSAMPTGWRSAMRRPMAGRRRTS